MEENHKFMKLEYYLIKYGLKEKEMAELMGLEEDEYRNKVMGIQEMSYAEMMFLYEVLNKKAKDRGDDALRLDDIFLD